MDQQNEPSAKLINSTVLDQLDSRDSHIVKQAAENINDYLRMKMREDEIFARILPPTPVSNDELDKQVDTDLPVKVLDKEPDSPGAITVPFASLPENRYIYGPRYRVMFDRVLTPRFTADVDKLRTYDMDIRQVLSDNALKDMMAEVDGKFIRTVNQLLLGVGVTIPETGAVQWFSISGGITRENLAEAMKILPRTNKRINVATVLINQVSIWDVVKFNREETGGDMSQRLFEQGFTEDQLMGKRWIVTIKRDLVPDNTIFLFAEPKFLGKYLILEDTTMYIERKAYFLEFFAYKTAGASIGNVAACARVDYTA